MTWPQRHPQRWMAVLLVLFLVYRLVGIFSPVSEPRPNRVRGDLVGYSTAYLQSTAVNAYQRDPLFADGSRTALLNRYSGLYMLGFDLMYRLADGRIEMALGLYSLLAQLLYLVGMFGLLYQLTRHAWASSIIAFASLIPSGFAGTGTGWGIPNAVILPFHLQTALSVWLTWAAYCWWIEPRPTQYRLVGSAGLGLLCALLAARLNVITGLAFVQWGGLVLVGLTLWGRIAWRELAAFSLGFGTVFVLLYLILAPAQQTADGSFSWSAAQAISAIGQGNMIFPWGSGRLAWLGLTDPKTSYLLAFGLHSGLTTLLGLVYWRWRQRWMLAGLVVVQAGYALLLMNAGLLPLLLLAYWFWRIGQGRWDGWDGALLAAWSLALLLGFGQQMLLYYLWESLQWVGVTALLFELARFAHFAYLPMLILLARLLAEWPWKGYWRGLGLVAITAMVVLQLGRVPFFIGPTLHESAPPLTRDYLSMAEWVRANSEPDALFHLSSLDGSLRYYGQRSVLAVREEWIYGMYTGIDPLRLRNQETQLILGRTDTQTLLRALQQAQADYLIAGPEQARPFNADSAIVYQNPTYTIYRVAAIPAEQSPLAQFPALYAAYQAYRPPWEGNAVLFNPATGNVAVRQSILEEVGRSTAQTWDEATLQSLHLLTQMRFEAELGLPAEAVALIGEWRNAKEASLLAQAGVDYLVVESEWLGFLSAPEYQALTTSPGYEWVGEWQIGPRRYFLYRVQP